MRELGLLNSEIEPHLDCYAGELPKWSGNSAKLNRFNAMGTHPLLYVAHQRGKFKPRAGWKCLGYASAPYHGCASHAIVYGHQGEYDTTMEIFWTHGFPYMEVEVEVQP